MIAPMFKWAVIDNFLERALCLVDTEAEALAQIPKSAAYPHAFAVEKVVVSIERAPIVSSRADQPALTF